MIEHKFRGRLDRASVIAEMTAAVRRRGGRRGRDDRRERGGRVAHRRRVPAGVRGRGAGGRRGPGPVLRHDRRRHAVPDPGAVRQAGQPGRPAGGDPLPQRPGHGGGQLGLRRARRPGRRVRRVGQHVRQRHRRAVRKRRPAVLHPGLQPRVRRGRARGHRRRARPELGPAVRAVGELRVRPAAAAEPARHRAERVRARVGDPRRRGAEGPAELRAVRRRHAGPVP